MIPNLSWPALVRAIQATPPRNRKVRGFAFFCGINRTQLGGPHSRAMTNFGFSEN